MTSHPKSDTYLKLREFQVDWGLGWNQGQKALVINNHLIAIMNDGKNSLDIYRLKIDLPDPHLKTVCSFELPPLTRGSNVCSRAASKEWVPTSKDYARYRSSRGYHSPFYSSTIRTLGLLLDYFTNSVGYQPPQKCTMVIDIAALISAIPTEERTVPWLDWGPSCAHIGEASWRMPAGPFWITDISPLVVRQFDVPRTWYAQSTTVDASTSSQTGPPVFSSTEVSGSFWKAGKVKTNLPYRDVSMASPKDFLDYYGLTTVDREWSVWVLPTVCWFCAYLNQSLIIRGDRVREHLSPCIMWCRSCTGINCIQRRPTHGSLVNIMPQY